MIEVQGERLLADLRTLAEFAEALGKVGVGNRAELTVQRDRSSRVVLVDVIDIS